MAKLSRIAFVVAVGLLVAACGDDSETVQAVPSSSPASTVATTVEVPSTVVATTAPPVTTTIPVAPLSALTERQLDFDRLGPIVIGMTLGQATEAAGVQFREDRIDSVSTCTTAYPLDGDGVWMILIDERIAAIHVSPPVTTVQGAGNGTSEADIRRIFGADHVEVFDHPYAGPIGHVMAAASPDQSLADFRIAFDTDGSVVTEFRAGTMHAAMLAEGCA